MPDNANNNLGNAGDVRSSGGTAQDSETVGEALSKEGFEPAGVGRRRISQGKRRETLKRRSTQDSS